MQNNFSRPIIFLQMESGIFKMHFYCCGDDSDESGTDGPLCGMSNYVFKTMIQILVSSGIEDT